MEDFDEGSPKWGKERGRLRLKVKSSSWLTLTQTQQVCTVTLVLIYLTVREGWDYKQTKDNNGRLRTDRWQADRQVSNRWDRQTDKWATDDRQTETDGKIKLSPCSIRAETIKCWYHPASKYWDSHIQSPVHCLLSAQYTLRNTTTCVFWCYRDNFSSLEWIIAIGETKTVSTGKYGTGFKCQILVATGLSGWY